MTTSIANEIDSTIKNYKKESYNNYEWLIKPCKIYKLEYKECKGYKGRFQQYFVNGELLDCNQWEKDYQNCMKVRDTDEEKAKVELIESELQRRKERMDAHNANDTWQNRKAPPADWNKPLPAFLVERGKNSLLYAKADEIAAEKSEFSIPDDNYCVIM